MLKLYTFVLIICLFTVVVYTENDNHNVKKNQLKKSVTGDKNWDDVLAAFRETIVRGFLQGDALKLTSLAAGHPIGIATVWLLTIIKATKDKEASEWDKMEEKITRKITASIDDNNIENLDDEFNRITYLMGKANRSQFTKKDLNEIRSYAPNFFPQQYTAGKFTVKWTNALTKYLAILNACYIDLMKQEVYDECEWADQLRELRPQIMTAAKKLAKSRYQDLEKKDWHGGTTIFKPTARLSFKDKATNTEYSKIPLQDIRGSVFTPLEQNTRSFLMENLIEKFNVLYNEKWVPSKCNTPPQISDNELDVSYPQACMDSTGTCTFPCGFYSWKNRWCVKFKNNRVSANKWETGGGGGRVFYNERKKHWMYCNYPDWEKCMKTPRVPLIEWSDEDYERKKKKLKKEPTKTEQEN